MVGAGRAGRRGRHEVTTGGGDGAETSVDGGVGDETLVAKMVARGVPMGEQVALARSSLTEA